mgnify:CR=1 FL=1
MVNIRPVANMMIQSINPDVQATVRRSTGYTTLPSGKRTPTYADSPITLQVQALSKSEIQHLDGLSIQGTARAIYFDGAVFGLVRAQQKGGDVIIFPAGTLPEGDEWLCVHVLEQWSPWGKVAIVLQNPGT